MKKIKIGKTRSGKDVYISDNAPNSHIMIVGVSGTGKSTRSDEIVCYVCKTGKTVIIFDLEGEEHNYPAELLNYIDLQNTGINMKLFNLEHIENGDEKFNAFLAYIVELLVGSQELGVRQAGILREAIIHAIEHSGEYGSELEAISDALHLIDTKGASGVYNKLWSVLESGAIHNEGKSIENGKINVISLGKMSASMQNALVEIILGILWREARFAGKGQQDMLIVLDEFQRLALSKKTILRQVFTQGLKYGLSLMVATQSEAFLNPNIKIAVDQAHTKLFFKPALKDAEAVARSISKTETEHYLLRLKKLKRGECIAIEDFEIEGEDYHQPMVTLSDMSFEHNNMDKKQHSASL